MTSKTVLLNVLLFSVVASIALFIYHKGFEKKLGYIDIKKVFDGFQMKKELEGKYKQTAKTRERITDSLSFNLKILSKALNEQKQSANKVDEALLQQFEFKREEFIKLKNQYDEDNAVLSSKLDGQILERITQYVLEYGKAAGYDIIYGADGNGNLMYARESYDLSNEIIKYINEKYKGK